MLRNILNQSWANFHQWELQVYVSWKSKLAYKFLGFHEKPLSTICEFWCLFFTELPGYVF